MDHPIYYFAPARPKTYVLYMPPMNALPTSAASGRYEYFLFQFLRSKNIGVFVLRVPDPTSDQWDHVPAHRNKVRKAPSWPRSWANVSLL
jgi:hypothetical protein